MSERLDSNQRRPAPKAGGNTLTSLRSDKKTKPLDQEGLCIVVVQKSLNTAIPSGYPARLLWLMKSFSGDHVTKMSKKICLAKSFLYICDMKDAKNIEGEETNVPEAKMVEALDFHSK